MSRGQRRLAGFLLILLPQALSFRGNQRGADATRLRLDD